MGRWRLFVFIPLPPFLCQIPCGDWLSDSGGPRLGTAGVLACGTRRGFPRAASRLRFRWKHLQLLHRRLMSALRGLLQQLPALHRIFLHAVAFEIPDAHVVLRLGRTLGRAPHLKLEHLPLRFVPRLARQRQQRSPRRSPPRCGCLPVSSSCKISPTVRRPSNRASIRC